MFISGSNGDRVHCEYCQKDYSCMDALRRHVRDNHTGVQMLKCDLCNAVLKNITSLNRHFLIHKKKGHTMIDENHN